MGSSNSSLTDKQQWFLDELAKGKRPDALGLKPNIVAMHTARLQEKGYLKSDGSLVADVDITGEAARTDARAAGIAAATPDSDVEVLFSMDDEVLTAVEDQRVVLRRTLDTLDQAIALHEQRGNVITTEIKRLEEERGRHGDVIGKLDQQRTAMREALDRLVAVAPSGQ